ncbi:MAG: type II CAAX endopeptidase family protein [Gallicola sp.]|nr:type II CAAX endopeptidase family protein [Gallicola sp.]
MNILSALVDNPLTTRSTGWKWYYALFIFVGVTLPSFTLGLIPITHPVWTLLQTILQFLLVGVLTLALVRLFQRRPFQAADLGFDRPDLTKKNIIIVIAVFLITHGLFFLLSKVSGVTSNAQVEFTNSGFGRSFGADLVTIIAGAIMAPVIEELVYRGVMLRSLQEILARLFTKSSSLNWVPVIVSLIVTAFAFVLPHVSQVSFGVMTFAYLISSIGMSLVYLTTGSMVMAMVSHSLQSCYAHSMILVTGKGDYVLSPIIFFISFACPIIVYLVGRGLKRCFR